MAINDEFSNAADRKFDASGEYASRSDASRQFKREMSGRDDAHAAIGGTFEAHGSAATSDVMLRDASAGLAGTDQESALRGLARYAQGASDTTLDVALRDFDKLDAANAAAFVETLSARLPERDREAFTELYAAKFGVGGETSFEGASSRLADLDGSRSAGPSSSASDFEGSRLEGVSATSASVGVEATEFASTGEFTARGQAPSGHAPAGRRTAEMAALAAGDALIGSADDNVVGASWNAGRAAQRVQRAVREHGGGKGGAMAVANAYLDEADDNVLTAGRDAYRTGRAVQQVGRNVRARRAANVSETSAKRKSMAIARATAAGDVTGEMSLATRLKAMAASMGASIASAISSGMNGLAPLAASALPVFVPILVVVLIAGSFGGIIGAIGSNDLQVERLTEVESQVYSFFKDKGLDDLHIAAIMGNMKAESGAHPANLQHVPGEDNSCPNEDILAIGPHVGGKAAGLFQWDKGRRHRLAQYARDTGRNWYEAGVQLEFFWDHDEWQGNWGSGQNTKSKFYATDDLATAVRIFCRGWERAGTEHLDTRVSYAQSYLDRFLSAKDGQPLSSATDAQKRVAEAARRQPAPAGSGWCAKWVSTAFHSAGQPYIGGNANDMFRSWCHSSDRSELKVGMIIAEDTSSHYGHVGIYVGDGKVLSSESNYTANTSQIRERTVDEWVRIFGAKGPVRWGWANGIDLSA